MKNLRGVQILPKEGLTSFGSEELLKMLGEIVLLAIGCKLLREVIIPTEDCRARLLGMASVQEAPLRGVGLRIGSVERQVTTS